MNKTDYDRLLNLAALTEFPGERDDFIQSLIPFYEMMEKVRNAVLEEDECLSGIAPAEKEGTVLELREDIPQVFTESERMLDQSERRDGAYFTVPRSI